METIKKLLLTIKEIIINIFRAIISLFKIESSDTKKVIIENKAKIDINKDEKIINTDSDINIPDEDSVKSDSTPLSYKQSIGTVSNDIKDEIIAKVNKREIYFSDVVVLNTIIDSVEKKKDFTYNDLEFDTKVKVKNEIKNIQDKISPSLKNDMSKNKITTMEELKVEVDKKVDNYLYKNNSLDVILNGKEENIDIEEEELPALKNKNKTITIVKEDKKPIIEIVEEKEPIVEINKEETSLDIKDEEIDKNKNDIIRIEKIDKDKTIINDNNNVYFMADLLKNKNKELDIVEKSKVSDNTELIPNLNKEVAHAIKDKANKLPFIMVPTSKKSANEIKEKIKNAMVDTIVVTTSASAINEDKDKEEVKDIEKKDILENKKEEKLELPKINEDTRSEEEIKLDDISLDKELLNEIKSDITNKPRKSFNSNSIKNIVQEIAEAESDKEEKSVNIELIKEEKNIDIDKEIENKDDIVKEVLLKSGIETKNTIDEEEHKDEEKLLEEDKEKVKEKIDYRNITSFNTQYDNTSTKFKDEKNKEDFEDRDYDSLVNKIDDILYNLEMFEIKNEDKITETDKADINSIRNRLRDLRNTVSSQRDIDLDEEKKILEKNITQKEINGLDEKIKQLHLENQEELDDMLLSKIKNIEKLSDKEIDEKESILIKSKLRNALLVAEIPSILALPFVKNKYFFYYTIGLIVNNHFNFLNAIFKRKDSNFEPIDLSQVKNGRDSLEQAINLTYKNMVYLDYLEKEAIERHPRLVKDREFNTLVSNIRTKLDKNYKRLNNKQKVIDRYIYKINKKNKVLRKYKLVREDKNAA